MATKPYTRLRAAPGISANELARYLVAGDHAREGIIRRAKEIATAPVIRYRDLRHGLSGYLANPVRPGVMLGNLEGLLQQKSDDPSLTHFVREDAAASLEALGSFRRFQNQLGGFDFKAVTRTPALPIEGVAVSIHPDLALTQRSRVVDRYGVVLFRFAKGEDSQNAASKRAEMAKYVATLALMEASEHCAANHIAHPSLCLSVDIHNQEIVAASGSYTNRRNDIKAACRQIARMWSHV